MRQPSCGWPRTSTTDGAPPSTETGSSRWRWTAGSRATPFRPGTAARVALTYAPDRGYRAGLFGGLFLAALLLVAAVVGQVLDRRRPVAEAAPVQASAPRRWGVGARRLGQTVTGGALLVLGGPVALAGYLCGRWRSVRGYALAAGGLALTSSAQSLRPWPARPPVADPAPSRTVSRPPASACWSARSSTRARGPSNQGTSASATWRAFRRWLTRHRVLLAGLLLVLGQAVLRVKVGAGSYFWQDDFLHLDLSRRLGLSRDYLVRDYSGHVEPAQYLVIWAVGQLGQGSFVPAVVVLVGLQALASTLLLVLLQLLFGRSPWLLVPFAAYLFTPLGLATATWLAAGLQAYPLQIAMLTSLIGLVRLEQTGRRRWWAVSLAGHLLGLVFWEKAALVLPALLAVELLVLSAGLSLRERGRRMWRRRAFWLSQVLVVVGYAGAYLAVTASGTFGAPLDQGRVVDAPRRPGPHPPAGSVRWSLARRRRCQHRVRGCRWCPASALRRTGAVGRAGQRVACREGSLGRLAPRRGLSRHGPDAAAARARRVPGAGRARPALRHRRTADRGDRGGGGLHGGAQAGGSEPRLGIEEAVAPVRAGCGDGRPAGRQWHPHHHVDGPAGAAHAG